MPSDAPSDPSSDDFDAYVAAFHALLHRNLPIPAEYPGPCAPRRVDASRPLVAIVSPHPDDECIVGGLPLRLRLEAGYEVLNIAATLGSNVGRRDERWTELTHACEVLDFATVDPHFVDRLPLHLKRRENEPETWRRDVARLAEVFAEHTPAIVMCPHAQDGSASHIGTHALTLDALALYGKPAWLVQSEFWGTMPTPNLLVELSNRDIAHLLRALVCHRKEVERNPYHLRLTSWLADSVRRGGETVFGAGLEPPSYDFGAVYRVDRWNGQRLEPLERRGAVGIDEPLNAFFEI
ncbi:PIG-L deacetylase family protein [Pararobbsia silviterrae]|uniref:PIG-L family deacetylase n=1 Tax=Pararobbsia silviterrae TaxID=1792498 RepID=A0A494XYZ0_9BURK|nr:PIG-L family deacetylase [Pararobbsia silviterrae]RKP55732.1 PIG-L family deacetylase [Pararobbsia silviterrae]